MHPAPGLGEGVILTDHCPPGSLPRCSCGFGPCQPIPGEPAPASDAEPAAGEPSAGDQHILRAWPKCGAHGYGLHDLHSLTPSSRGQQFLPDTLRPCHNEHGGQRGHPPIGSSGDWHNQPFPSLVPRPGTCSRANAASACARGRQAGTPAVERCLRVGVGWAFPVRFLVGGWSLQPILRPERAARQRQICTQLSAPSGGLLAHPPPGPSPPPPECRVLAPVGISRLSRPWSGSRILTVALAFSLRLRVSRHCLTGTWGGRLVCPHPSPAHTPGSPRPGWNAVSAPLDTDL